MTAAGLERIRERDAAEPVDGHENEDLRQAEEDRYDLLSEVDRLAAAGEDERARLTSEVRSLRSVTRLDAPAPAR